MQHSTTENKGKQEKLLSGINGDGLMISSPHHSLDTDLAIQLQNVEIPVLVHQLQLADTPIALPEIDAIFPYWSLEKIKQLLTMAMDFNLIHKKCGGYLVGPGGES